jgi:hypothetical protein
MTARHRLCALEARLRTHVALFHYDALFTNILALLEQALDTAGVSLAQRQAIAAQLQTTWQQDTALLPEWIPEPQAVAVVEHFVQTSITLVETTVSDTARRRTIFAHMAAGMDVLRQQGAQ